MSLAKKYITVTIILLSLLAAMSCVSEDDDTLDLGLAALVDTRVGTGAHGHVYPGATVPFGAVQLSPDNGQQGWDWCSGYHYSDSIIVGFSHTHLSGTGIGDLCDVSIMPTVDAPDLTLPVDDPREATYASSFSHDREVAYPGYYQVLLDNRVNTELTASTHTGHHRYTFPQGTTPGLLLDLGFSINWDRTTDGGLEQLSETKFVGWRHSTGWAKDQRVHFCMQFSAAPTIMVFDSTIALDQKPWQGKRLRAYFEFPPDEKIIELHVGISSANAKGAEAAVDSLGETSFDQMHRKALSAWNDQLGKLEVSSYDPKIEKNFYTALYHAQLAPVLYEDVLGAYKSPDGSIKTASDFQRYDIFSLWDTFRAAHPLLTLVQPGMVNDFVRSLLDHYAASGRLPVWSLLGNETNTMTGYHAVPVITDAYFKGFRDYDVSQAFAAMQTSAMQDIRGTDHYRKFAYIPYGLDGQSVTKTLEYAYDDWCISQMAFVLGDTAAHDVYHNRSQNFRNIFDPQTGFMRAKLPDGRWKTPFDPTYSDHDFSVAEYTEGNAWQHSWFVPHDVRSLINLHGGRQAFVDQLDSLFNASSEITGENASADISGLIGQYAHGNEPSHHIPYLYNYAGFPWKTQELVRQIAETLYDTIPAGLCGNEDCGQMSAWYVFAALGFYPVNPAEGVYVFGTPMLNKAVLHLPDGNTFTIRVRFLTEENKYIQTATLNEAPLSRSYLRHFEIVDGGELILEMGPEPNLLHWIDEDAVPPSASDPESDRF